MLKLRQKRPLGQKEGKHMCLEIKELSGPQAEEIENMLNAFDSQHMAPLSGQAAIGIFWAGKLVAGAVGCMTAYRIFYLSTIIVAQEYRGQGLGKRLMQEVEARARKLGANLIRLDTFNSQGRDFYLRLGYEEAGAYHCPEDGFSEHFFLKRL